ncbi:MAG TPA: hypothetical protein PKD86_12815 [Gemmatales bacterium]|nr:hypothetical protein [Gemmatales bacterium]HMP60225.1 hypothetical protein [Gemmatales bacterium]
MKLYPDDWRIRLCGAAGCLAGGTIALFVIKPMFELPLWIGGLAFVALIGIGIVLGQFIGSRLFPPSSGGPSAG